MNIQQGILLLYFLVSVNFLFNKMKDFSCHVQTIVNKNLVAKHGLNILAVFFVLVLFTRSLPVHPLILIGLTFVMYVFFLLITKCDYKFLTGFLLCMVIVFYIEAHKLYKVTQEPQNAEAIKEKYSAMQMYIQILSIVLVLFGFVIYIGQHAREYKDTWNWKKFWIGVAKCSENGSYETNVFKDFDDGIKRLVK